MSHRAFNAEDRLVTWLRKRLQAQGVDLLGDDGAVLPSGGPWVTTCDQQIAGTHLPPDIDPAIMAGRLLSVNLSDLAAMGAVPRYAFLALSFHSPFDPKRFLEALLAACRKNDVVLAGGDMARSTENSAVLTLTGTRTPHGRWLTRAAARPGDGLWLGGDVGLSTLGRILLTRGAGAHGRRLTFPSALASTLPSTSLARRALRAHLFPQPQLPLGQWLARRRRVAAIDVSDGLALDLHRLCRESEVGAEVIESLLPSPRGFIALCGTLAVEPRSAQLTGGEDYALLFTLPQGTQPPRSFRCRKIGRIVAGRRLSLCGAEGAENLPVGGWDHFAPK